MTKKIEKTAESAVMVRPLDVIAVEIRSIDTQTREFVLRSAIEIGKRLAEAKSVVAHGEWGKWLETNVSYSQSSANNFMRIAVEYNLDNTQSLAKLNYTQAIALLALPAEERESFTEENDVAAMSIRELQTAIREKQELERLLQEGQEQLRTEQLAREEEKVQREALHNHYQQELELRRKAEEELIAAQQAAQNAAEQTGDKKAEAKLKVDLRKAEKAVAESKKRIEDLESEIEAKIKKREQELTTELENKLLLREQELADRSKGIEEAAANKLNEMQEQLRKNNNVSAIKVKVQFETLVSHFNNLLGSVAELENEDQKKAIQERIAALCDQMKGNL